MLSIGKRGFSKRCRNMTADIGDEAAHNGLTRIDTMSIQA